MSRFVIPAYIPRSDEDIVSLDLNDASVFLPFAAIDFGAVFNSSIQNMMLDGTVIQEVKHRCMGFLVEATKQIHHRLRYLKMYGFGNLCHFLGLQLCCLS